MRRSKKNQASLSVTERHRASPSVTKCHQASPSVTERHRVSPSVTKRHQASPSVTKCHHAVTSPKRESAAQSLTSSTSPIPSFGHGPPKESTPLPKSSNSNHINPTSL